FILGELALVSSPSYSYGVVGLVLASGAGCGYLNPDTSSVSLVLFLVYLGRILVGFVYPVSGSRPLSRILGGLKSFQVWPV
ncbi:NU6M oxidoreductase, partial [Vireo altiloquus]|nr:NU6M oxidoreductase [Vireo altiloquus]